MLSSTARLAILAGVIGLSLSSGRSARPLFAASPTFPPRVTLAQIQQRIGEAPKTHPRLLATREQLTNLSKTLDSDPLRRQLADAIIREAKHLGDVPPIERKLIGRRLLDKSRTCVERVTVLAMAYHLTGDSKYVERCQQEMLTAARFSDWHPEHFLDTAEMTFALALGYDWLFDRLDDANRQEIRTAIIEKGVRVPFDTKFNGWVRATNNWGQVCHGGLTAGALAVMEDEPELAARIVYSAVTNVVPSMNAFAPRGSYPEGPSYWSYGTTYNVLLIGVLESALGSDFGLADAPGFNETGAYPALACGPSGLFFNYADGSDDRGIQPARFWFAARYQRPDWLRDERAYWSDTLAHWSRNPHIDMGRSIPLALLWIGPPVANVQNRLPLHWQSEGSVPVTIHRSSWNDADAVFVGLKAGSPSGNHGHMDVGSFVLDSDGVRWAADLGAEPYHGIETRGLDLWNRAQNSDRWKIFRLNNFSHNTLVIDGQLQFAAGDAAIEKFSDAPGRPFSIVDMTPVFKGQAAAVKRGVALLPSHEVLIQDELTGLKPGSRVRWGMLTPGQPAELGRQEVELHQQDKRLTLKLLAPRKLPWREIETAKPPHEWDSPNPGTRMIAFEAVVAESGTLTLVVLATPGSCKESVAEEFKPQPLNEWGDSAASK